MKGLLKKDLAYLKQNKIIFIFLIIFGIFYSFFYDNSYFILGYYSIFAGILTLTTFSYDEFHHGLAFILTLPVSRKQYITSKYCLSGILSLILCFLASLLSTLSQYKNVPNFSFFNSQWMFSLLLVLLFSFIISAFMIPVQVKLSADKAQYAMFIVFGTIAIMALALYTICQQLNINLEPLLNTLFSLNLSVLSIISILAVAFISWLSFHVSVRFITKKEF